MLEDNDSTQNAHIKHSNDNKQKAYMETHRDNKAYERFKHMPDYGKGVQNNIRADSVWQIRV